MVNPFFIGHVISGLPETVVGYVYTYHLFDHFLRCESNEKMRFTTVLHIYHRRFRKVSVTALVLAIAGCVTIVPSLYNRQWGDNDTHAVFGAAVALTGTWEIITRTTNIPWPRGLDKLVAFILMMTTGSSFLAHGISKHHPMGVAIHVLLAALFLIVGVCLVLEMRFTQSFLVNLVRNLCLITMGTWLLQTACFFRIDHDGVDLDKPLDLYSQDSSNTSFVVVTFIAHLLGNLVLMVMMYVIQAYRWRHHHHQRQPLVGARDTRSWWIYTHLNEDGDDNEQSRRAPTGGEKYGWEYALLTANWGAEETS